MINIFRAFIFVLIFGSALQAENCATWLLKNNVGNNGWPQDREKGCLVRPRCVDETYETHPCRFSKKIKCPETVYSVYTKYNERLMKDYQNLTTLATLPDKFYNREQLTKQYFDLFDLIYHTFFSDFQIQYLTHDGKLDIYKGVDAYKHARYVEFIHACPISERDFDENPPQQLGLKAFFNASYRMSSKPKNRRSMALSKRKKMTKSRVLGVERLMCKQFPNACQLSKQLVGAFSRHNKVAGSELNEITHNLIVAIQSGYSPKNQRDIQNQMKAYENKLKLRDNQRLALWLRILELFGLQQNNYKWADFNNDNKADFVFKPGNSGSIIEVYLSSYNDSYLKTASLKAEHAINAVSVMDFNRDNKPDLIAQADSNLPEDDIYFEGLGNGTFRRISENPCDDENLNGIPDCDENHCTKPACYSGGLSGYLGTNIGANVNVRDADTGSRYKVANQLKAFYIELNSNQASADALLFATTVPKSPRTHDVYSRNGRLSGTQNGSDWDLSMFAKQPSATSSYLMTISLADPPSDRKNPATEYKVQVSFGMPRALEYHKEFVISLDQNIICQVKRNQIWGVSCSIS